ncbi:MAG TPA: DUF4271 domain-containing protein [Flavobacteriales bacterium]|nr:DUF4271 domain-containing protein [Flavobacteriales bacterium]
MIPVPRAHDPLSADWITLLLLGCLVMLVVIHRTAPRMWRVLSQGNFRMRLGRQLMREDIDLQDRNYLGLLLVAIAIIGLFVWQYSVQRLDGSSPTYPTLVGLVAVVIIAQALIPRLSAALLRMDAGALEYVYTGTLITSLLGLLLIPVVALAAYQVEWRPALFVIGAVLLSTALLYRWIRGAWIGMNGGVKAGYIFLYFCAAEIVPFLLVFHTLRQAH